MLKLGELGEVSFGKYKLGELDKVSFGILKSTGVVTKMWRFLLPQNVDISAPLELQEMEGRDYFASMRRSTRNLKKIQLKAHLKQPSCLNPKCVPFHYTSAAEE